MNATARWLFIILFLILNGPARAAAYGPYMLIAPSAIDGDTLRADVAIWPDTIADVAIRIIGVDTPELRSKSECEKALAEKARAFTETWLLTHAPVSISGVKPDKYAGRFDAVVTGRDGALLAADLIAAGHGRAYDGGAREAWCP